MALEPSLDRWLARECASNGLDVLARQGVAFISSHVAASSSDTAPTGTPTIRSDWQHVIAFALLFEQYGHTCLPLEMSPRDWAEHIGLDPDGLDGSVITPNTLQGGEHSRILNIGGPMVLDGNRVSIRRLHDMESNLAEHLMMKSRQTSPDPEPLRAVIEELFPDKDQNPEPAAAAVIACTRRLLILSGGPGTGKTTTVARILAALTLLQTRRHASPLRIGLAAPTGKAAARLTESLDERLGELRVDHEELHRIPTQAVTLHRMLLPYRNRGLVPDHRPTTLPLDLLVVDEASMLDIRLFHRLVEALPEHAALIAVGDRNQLSSVEAGAVLDDLCTKKVNGFSVAVTATLRAAGVNWEKTRPEASPMEDCTVYLEKNWRFGETSGIGRLAAGILDQASEDQDAPSAHDALTAILEDPDYPDVGVSELTVDEAWIPWFVRQMDDRHAKSMDIRADRRLEYWLATCWLTPLRNSRFGTRNLNRAIETRINKRLDLRRTDGWYPGRPVIITRNDYRTGLFNGDMGVCLKDPGDGNLHVLFQTESGPRRFPVHSIPEHEPAYLLTVHKSQGSEFEHVHLLLPPDGTPLLSRELLFTAVTRAKLTFTLHGDPKAFAQAAGIRNLRHTGLRQRVLESNQPLMHEL